MPPPPRHHHSSATELKARIEQERGGDPFVVYREPSGEQRILSLGGRDALVVGRSTAADLPLPWDTEVSRVHAELRCVGQRWVVSDDGLSRNGTFVNGERVRGSQPLSDGDELRAGETTIEFRQRAEAAGDGVTRTATGGAGPPVPVTAAQLRVLVALCRPLGDGAHLATPATNQQIADELYLSVAAVKTHLRALFVSFAIGDLPQNEKRMRLAERALADGHITQRELRGE